MSEQLSKKKRYLITTSDESTWKFDQPVIFLSHWSKPDHRKHVWEKLDYTVSNPYMFKTSNDKKKYHLEIKNIENKLLSDLVEILNKYHQINYTKQFWLIFMGSYLITVIKKIASRVNELKECFLSNEISGTTFYESDFSSLIFQNDLSLIATFRDNKFNNILNYKILKSLGNFKFQEDFLKDKNFTILDQTTNSNLIHKGLINKRKLYEIFLKTYFKIARIFVKENDAFIINTYLGMKEEIKLELSLKQLPQAWNLDDNNLNYMKISVKEKPDLLKRKIFKKEILKKSNNELDKIIRSLIFELLPTCYMEDFAFLNKFVNNLPWPKKPKFVFTSNNYTYDSIFKLWIAKKVGNGTKYFIGQHGNNLGTRWDLEECIEEVTPNKFLTWGWSKDLKKQSPCFVFKNAGKKIDYNKNSNLLLVEQALSPNTDFDNSNILLKYFNNQKIFINSLNISPRKNLTIKLHNDDNMPKLFDEKLKWLEFDSKLKIHKPFSNFNTLISKCRLVVHSYDSTTFLETLSLNIPTIAFWDNSHNNVKKGNGLDHLNDNAKIYYQMLIDVGIIHLNATSAANKVNEIWNNVEGWWSQKRVQIFRSQFCEIYAKNEKNPINKLKEILLS